MKTLLTTSQSDCAVDLLLHKLPCFGGYFSRLMNDTASTSFNEYHYWILGEIISKERKAKPWIFVTQHRVNEKRRFHLIR